MASGHLVNLSMIVYVTYVTLRTFQEEGPRDRCVCSGILFSEVYVPGEEHEYGDEALMPGKRGILDTTAGCLSSSHARRNAE